MGEVVITIFIEQSLSFPFSVCSDLEGREKELEAEELSQPAKNHQEDRRSFF